MPSHSRTIWDNSPISNMPPAVRNVKLEYPGMLEKVELSFKFDVSNFPGCILDENKPVVINDEVVPIPLPSDKVKLKLVEISGIDVTKFLRASPKGESNKIVVNYKVRDGPWFFGHFGKKDVGRLRLALTVNWLEPDRKCDRCGKPIPSGMRDCPICHPPNQKFCMWHGEPVQPTAVVCPFQGGPKYPTTFTPNEMKVCPNPGCKKKIYVKEIYCEYCGTKQPTTA